MKQEELDELALIEFNFHNKVQSKLEAKTKTWSSQVLCQNIHCLKMYLSGISERNSALIVFASFIAIGALLFKSVAVTFLLVTILIFGLIIPLERNDLSSRKHATEELIEHLELILQQRQTEKLTETL
ncbi:hypothetical protein AADZ91_16650 [Colwelliaceae bacterium 6441]